MNTSNRYIQFLAFAAVLTGFALASLHHHDIILDADEVIVEAIKLECSMCDGTVKIGTQLISAATLDFKPTSSISDQSVQAAFLPFEKITKERAPPSRA